MEEKYRLICERCLAGKETDPLALARAIMNDPTISMHGPEHHLLDGACLLTALHNAGLVFDLGNALEERARRSRKMPGATCGQWGVCGAAASVGAALSVLRGIGPLSDSPYYKDNMHCVSAILNRIADVGGPRCCKRNAFIALETAADFLRETYGIDLPCTPVPCAFSSANAQCIGERCPYHQNRHFADEVLS